MKKDMPSFADLLISRYGLEGRDPLTPEGVRSQSSLSEDLYAERHKQAVEKFAKHYWPKAEERFPKPAGAE